MKNKITLTILFTSMTLLFSTNSHATRRRAQENTYQRPDHYILLYQTNPAIDYAEHHCIRSTGLLANMVRDLVLSDENQFPQVQGGPLFACMRITIETNITGSRESRRAKTIVVSALCEPRTPAEIGIAASTRHCIEQPDEACLQFLSTVEQSQETEIISVTTGETCQD